MNIMRIAMRIAFRVCATEQHIKSGDVKALLGSDAKLQGAFMDAVGKHDKFMEELALAASDRLSDSAIRRLKFLRGGLNDVLRSLLKLVRDRFPGASFFDIEQKTGEVLGQEILNPNTLVRDMNLWTYDWHEVVSNLAAKASGLLRQDSRAAPELAPHAQA